jgi:hypothetical protein
MSNNQSTQWTALAVAGAGVGTGLSIGGSYYIMKNSQHKEMHLYLLATFGFGAGTNVPTGPGGKGLLLKIMQQYGITFWDDSSFSDLDIGTAFSANELHLATGSEYSAGGGVGAGYFYCTINATKGFTSLINFSNVSGKAAAVGAGVYTRAGLWIKLESSTF